MLTPIPTPTISQASSVRLAAPASNVRPLALLNCANVSLLIDGDRIDVEVVMVFPVWEPSLYARCSALPIRNWRRFSNPPPLIDTVDRAVDRRLDPLAICRLHIQINLHLHDGL